MQAPGAASHQVAGKLAASARHGLVGPKWVVADLLRWQSEVERDITASLFERNDPELCRRDDEQAAAQVLRMERDNLREAMTSAVRTGDLDAGFELIAALEDYTIERRRRFSLAA